ncbi:MAG TPA: M48 family metalloprotease, partial [Steroidobacteraceae bacterium]|nr:M48 family metalloprotease [Steroidobacteraceae bacterium]
MLLFILAVLGVIAAVNLIVSTVLVNLDEEAGLLIPDGRWLAAHPGTLALTSLLVLAVVGLSSLYKVASLREGGGAVARNLGGTRIERTLDDPLRRRLFNVVEEMAIASGVPMPEVYVLEQESAINAFAAGHSPANAAIAV